MINKIYTHILRFNIDRLMLTINLFKEKGDHNSRQGSVEERGVTDPAGDVFINFCSQRCLVIQPQVVGERGNREFIHTHPCLQS